MRKLLFFLLIVFSGFAALSQDKVLLSENFKNNKNGWQLKKDSSFSVEVNQGVLRWEKFRKNFDDRGCLWYKKEINGLNTLEDFSITLFAKLLSGGDHSDVFDIQWGTWDKVILSKVTSIYQLNFFLKGDVKLDHYNKGWNYSLRKQAKEILDKNLYLTDRYNKYEIVQKDGFIIFKINDKQYFKQFATPINGNSIGIQGCLKSAWVIDKIIVKQLKRKTGDTALTIPAFVAIDSFMRSGKSNEGALKVFPNPFRNEFMVAVPMARAANAKIELLDVTGNLLIQYDRKLETGEHNIPLYADVPPGTYILKLTVENKITSTRIVKL